MKLHRIEKAVRECRNVVLFNIASIMGKTFIPSPRETINIEVTSSCNLRCRFCAYRKKTSVKTTMTNEFFFNCVTQAVGLGFRKFQLTPVTGEVFMDPNFFEKLFFLENHPDVESYAFFTNFTVPDHVKINHLCSLNKMEKMTISIYGHNLESFVAITQASEKIYQRLVSNLEVLLSKLSLLKFPVEIGLRSYHKGQAKGKSPTQALLRRFSERGVRVRASQVYNNWGGYITKDDVEGLDIDITDSNSVYKKGACVMLFNSVMLKADGIVNGCPCRDVDATLRIGDLKSGSLAEILSGRNEKYMQLIKDQQRGNYPAVCDCCDFYKSIYHYRPLGKRTEPNFSLQEFMALAQRTGNNPLVS